VLHTAALKKVTPIPSLSLPAPLPSLAGELFALGD